MLKPRSLARKLAGRSRLAILTAAILVLATAVPVLAANPVPTSANNGDAGATTITVPKPSGVAEGDVMIASIAMRINITTITPPAGWNLIVKRATTSGDDTALATYWKLADATDANILTTGYTWTGLAASTRAFGAIARYDDVAVTGSPATPVAANVTLPTPNDAANQDGSTLTASLVTTTQPGSYVTAIYGVGDVHSITSGPSGMTELYNNLRSTGTTGTGRLVGYDVSQAAAGSSLAKTVALGSGGSGNAEYTSQTIALKPKPTKLGFSTLARSGAVNDCLGPITVQTQNTAGVAVQPLAATEIGVASDGTGSFFNNAACDDALDPAERTIGTGATSTTFYYKPTDRGTGSHQITATATGLTQAQQTQTVKSNQTITFAGPSSPQVYGNTVDIGPATSDSGLTVTVTPSGGCGPLSGSNTTITSATTDCTLTATQAGDSSYNAATPVVRTIVTDPRPITVTADSGQSKVYSNNAATDPVLTKQVTSGNLVGTDTFTGALARTAGETVAGSPYAITQGTLSAGNNYAITFVGANFTITKKELTVNANTASKTYGSLDPNLTANLTGFVSGQNRNNAAGFGGSESCSRTTGETVAGSPYTITCTVGTLVADNYSFAQGTTANFTINRKQININADPASKTYGETDPAFTGVLTGFVNGEDATSAGVTGDKSCSRSNPLVEGAGTYTGAITCAAGTLAADNYSFATGTAADFTINKKALSVNADPGTKVYGDTDPTFTASLDGFVNGEDATSANVTGLADCTRAGTDQDVGTYLDVLSCTAGTLDAANYSFTPGGTNDFTVTKRTLTVDADPKSKTYGDADPDFTATLNNFAFGEDETSAGVTGSAICDRSGTDEDAGTYTDVITCDPNDLDADNYAFVAGDAADFTINKKQLAINADPGSKTYGASDPTFTGTLSGFVNGEDETSANVTGTEDCDRTGSQEDVGLYDDVITCAQGTLDAANYSFGTGDAADFTINKRQLTVDANPASKTYGQSDPAFTATLNNFAFGENRATGGVTGDEACARAGSDEDAGTYNDVLGCGVGTLDADNYSFIPGDTADFTINQKTVSAGFTADNKVYDRLTDANISASDLDETDLEGTDDVTLDDSAAEADFADRNVGTNKTVTATGFALDGADAGNYSLSLDPETANITAKPVDGSFTAADKEYDGTTAATASNRQVDAADVISPDVVTLTGGTATFDDENVGNNKTVTLSGATLGGADAGNYQLSAGAITDQANITAKQLTGHFAADDKVYDGDDSATGTRSLTGVVGTEDVSLTGGTPTFADKNVGNNKTVTLAGASLTGTDNANYTLAPGAITDLANITAKGLTVSGAAAQSKVYDGTPSANLDLTGASLTGVESGDTVSIAGSGNSASFNNKNRGNGKPVNATIALSGTDAGNYTVTPPAGLTADITPKSVTGSFTADNKVYNGSSAATVAGRSLSGAIAGDDVSLSGGSASFANPNVGNNKTVTLTGAVLDPTGVDVANYTLASVGTDTANITKKSVTGHFTAADKEFDGTKDATITGRSLTGAISGDDVSLSGGVAGFVDEGPGEDITVLGFSFTLAGTDAGNYSLSAVDSTTATIQRGPGDVDNPPTEEELEQGASDKLGGDVKPLGTDFAGLAFGFAPEDQGKKLDPTNQALFAIGCTDDCDIAAKKTVVLTTGAGASAAATKKLKLKTQNMSLAAGELGVVKLKLTKKQKKAIKKAKKAKLVTKTTVTSGAATAADKKTYRLTT